MSYKEWTAAIGVMGALVIAAWVAWEGWTSPPPDMASAAIRLLWGIGFAVAFNVAALIVVTIFVSAARREAFEDDASDERDRTVAARAMRNSYLVLSIGGIATLLHFAFGDAPVATVYILFGAMLLAGTVDAASRLVYYRLG